MIAEYATVCNISKPAGLYLAYNNAISYENAVYGTNYAKNLVKGVTNKVSTILLQNRDAQANRVFSQTMVLWIMLHEGYNLNDRAPGGKTTRPAIFGMTAPTYKSLGYGTLPLQPNPADCGAIANAYHDLLGTTELDKVLRTIADPRDKTKLQMAWYLLSELRVQYGTAKLKKIKEGLGLQNGISNVTNELVQEILVRVDDDEDFDKFFFLLLSYESQLTPRRIDKKIEFINFILQNKQSLRQ